MGDTEEINALIEWVYNEFSQLIWYTALAYVGETEACDVVQEIMLRLLEQPKILKGREPGEMRAFVVKATKNYCIDCLRVREAKTASYEGIVESAGDRWQAYHGNPLDWVETQELVALLARTIKRMSPENRIVWEQHLRHQLSYQEIADLMHLKKRTVEKRLSVGRKEIRRIMRGVGYHV
ncbi:MAG: sigma-70 family RNA polymerase sigma factor [Lachnospiraceae bacterium]|nr:sigma-70 family RNA polymerase sigma factor [Lachnospiraceae bacterium]